jgi:tetratricopeptide (TPR) repeat protein
MRQTKGRRLLSFPPATKSRGRSGACETSGQQKFLHLMALWGRMNQVGGETDSMRGYRTLLVGIAGGASLLVLLELAPAASDPAAETLQRIQQLIQQGNLAAARNQLTEAQKRFPGEPGVDNLLGVVEAQQGNYGAAESSFRRAIARAPQFTGAYVNLGRLYQENASKDPEALRKALDTYQKLLKFQPSDLEANYQSAVLLAGQGSFKASLAHLSRLPPEAQERPQALALRVAGLVGSGERAQADAAATRLLAHPELTEADVISILPTLAAHQYEDLSIRFLEGLAARQLASSDTLRRLGLFYKQQGQLDRARSTLERAAQGQPNLVPLLLDLAHVAYNQKDYKGALGYLAHARDLEPQNASIHFFFGLVCIEENLVQEAYVALKKAVSLDPNNPYHNYAFGTVALQRDNPREAISAFQKYCEMKAQDPRGRLALATAYFYSHEHELARQELETVSQFRETAAGAQYLLGRMDNQQGKFADALRHLEEALKVNPGFASAYAELGLLYLKQREFQSADEALQRALKLDHDNYSANFNLMVLYQRTKDERAKAQRERFEEVKKRRAEQELELLRTIEVQP